MWLPFRSNESRIELVVAELDTCLGQIDALLDLPETAEVEAITGPIEVRRFEALSSRIDTAFSDMRKSLGAAMNGAWPGSFESRARYTRARTDLAADVREDRPAARRDGRRAGEVAARAARAMQEAYTLIGKMPIVVDVDDPFGEPEPDREAIRLAA